MSENILQALATEVATNMLNQPERKIKPDEALISSGMIDSFHLIDLALYVEDTFGVIIDDSELNANTFDTLNQLAELIVSRRN